MFIYNEAIIVSLLKFTIVLEFSSNHNRALLIQLIKVFWITGNFQAGVSWSWLELNSAAELHYIATDLFLFVFNQCKEMQVLAVHQMERLKS